MRNALNHALALLLVCLATIPAHASDATPGIGTALYYSNDNENFYTRRLALEYLPKYNGADILTGVRYTSHYYAQNTWSDRGKQISFLHRQIEPTTANGWQLEAGIFEQNDHDLLTIDASYRVALTDRTAVEAFINRDWVETQGALDNGTSYTFAGASLDYSLNRKITLVGLAGVQSFSDNNSRNHGRIKLIYQPDLDLGFTIQARYRAYTSSSSDVSNAYFNPDSYDEAMLAIGWRQKIHAWMTALTAGAGQQRIASDPASSTHLLEFSLKSPLANKRYSLGISAAMIQNADAFNGPSYRYSYLRGELIFAL